MSEERKRVPSKEIPIIGPKKREPIIDEISQERSKIKLEDKYVKIGANDSAIDFKIIGDRRQRGELGLPYYTIENEKGYFYYIVLKTI